MRKLLFAITVAALSVAACSEPSSDLPRGKASEALDQAFEKCTGAMIADGMELHSMMVLQHGKVLEEKWFGEAAPDKPHVMWSVSKTFTSAAVGLAIDEGLLSLDTRLVDIFPDKLPEHVSDTLKRVTIEHLLTMSCGQDREPSQPSSGDWASYFLSYPLTHEPGEWFWYNSMGTYMLSAAIQEVTGQKVVDYLDARLFAPLGIAKPVWDESPQGINLGGWGLNLRTEDMAKMGQLLLNGGRWRGKKVLPASWVKEMSSAHIYSAPAGWSPEAVRDNKLTPENSDWMQGYCYQMWRCRHNAFRADGAYGQYIIVLPDQDAVVAVTANIGDMQKEINYIWDYILPAL